MEPDSECCGRVVSVVDEEYFRTNRCAEKLYFGHAGRNGEIICDEGRSSSRYEGIDEAVWPSGGEVRTSSYLSTGLAMVKGNVQKVSKAKYTDKG